MKRPKYKALYEKAVRQYNELAEAIEQAQKCNKQCGVCGENEAFTGTCGGGRDKPNALCFEGRIEPPQRPPEQEPVAYLVYAKGTRRYFTLTFDVEKVPEIYIGGEAVPLYARPPQRQPLTDEQAIEAMWKARSKLMEEAGIDTEGMKHDIPTLYAMLPYFRAAEAAHNIKE